MADKSKEKKSKEEKKKAKAEKKALKKEVKEAKKRAKAAAKLEKKNNKDTIKDSNEKSDTHAPKEKKNFFTIKKLIIFSVLLILIMGSAFVVYKLYFSSIDESMIYKSIVLKNVNLPDEMLEFSFDKMNDLYFALATYNLRIFLLNKEINRITKVGENYPDQNKIAEKEKKVWIKAKEKVEKKFIKLEKEIKELYVLYNVNKEMGKIKIKEKSPELILQADETLKSLDPYMEKIELGKEKEPQGFINNTIYKIKKIL